MVIPTQLCLWGLESTGCVEVPCTCHNLCGAARRQKSWAGHHPAQKLLSHTN